VVQACFASPEFKLQSHQKNKKNCALLATPNSQMTFPFFPWFYFCFSCILRDFYISGRKQYGENLKEHIENGK
jgi:hypothetical protein